MAKEAKTKKMKSPNAVKFTDSIKTRLIAVMLLVVIVPLVVATAVSYKTSTTKATDDAIDALDWQAWYVEAEFETIIQKNFVAMQAIAAAPSTKNYFINPSDLTTASRAQSYLNAVDSMLDDGNISVLTGPDGMQLLRASGKLVDVSKREYFQQAMAGNIFASDVITSASTGARQTTFACPVFGDDGSVVGVVQRNYDLNEFHKFLTTESENAYICDRQGMMAAHSEFEITAENEENFVYKDTPFMTSDSTSGSYTAFTGEYNAIICYAKDEITGWTVCCAKNLDEVKAAAKNSALIVIIIGIILAIIAGIISVIMARSFTDPIGDVSESLSQLAD